MAPATDTERFWDEAAAGYDAAHDLDQAGTPLRRRMDVVLRLLGAPPGSVVDCGMGPGRLLVELERRRWCVAGVDLSGEMVELARARLRRSAERLQHGSIESLPFQDGEFDAAVATGVLEYVKDLPRALSEVARVLRPGGVFVVGAPNTRGLRTVWRHRVVYSSARAAKAVARFGGPVPLPRPGLVSPTRLRSLLAAATLDVEHVEHLILVPRPLDVLAPAGGRQLIERLQQPPFGWVLGSQLVVLARKRRAPDESGR